MPQVDLGNTPIPPQPPIELMVARYEDLTQTEMVGNVAWFRLSRRNEFNEAFRALQVALDLEHFIAVLPLDPKHATEEMIEELKSLRRQTEAITGQFVRLNFLGETTGDDDAVSLKAALQRHIDETIANV